MVEQAGEDQPAAGRERARHRRRELDQRPGEDVGDDEVVGRPRLQPPVRRAGRHRQLETAATPAQPDPVDRGILGRHLDRDRVDVGGDGARRRPQPHRREGEQAGAGADIGEIGEIRALALQRVEGEQAAGRGLVLAGAEGAPGVDLEGDRARRHRSRWAGVWTKKRPARIGSSPCWLSVTQSSSPTRSAAARVPLALGTRAVQMLQHRGGRLRLEIGVEPPCVGAVGFAGHQHRRRIEHGELGDVLAQRFRLRPGAGQGDLPAGHLNPPLDFEGRGTVRSVVEGLSWTSAGPLHHAAALRDGQVRSVPHCAACPGTGDLPSLPGIRGRNGQRTKLAPLTSITAPVAEAGASTASQRAISAISPVVAGRPSGMSARRDGPPRLAT